MATYTLSYQGFEVWLRDSNRKCIQLSSTQPRIDEKLQMISAAVQMKPMTSFTLLWRREIGRGPVSALCEVYLRDGYFKTDTRDFCVAKIVMDKTNKATQERMTNGHLNSPYKCKGTLKAGRLCDYPPRSKVAVHCPPHNSPELASSVRLEIRRVRGEVVAPQRVSSPDGQQLKESSTKQMDFIDDAQRGMLPFATFVFEIPPPKANIGIPPTINTQADSDQGQPSHPTTKTHQMILRRGKTRRSSYVGVAYKRSAAGSSKSSRSNKSAQESQPVQRAHRPYYPTPSSPSIIEIDYSDEEPLTLDPNDSGSLSQVRGEKRKTRDWVQDISTKVLVKEEKSIKMPPSDIDLLEVNQNDLMMDYLATSKLEKELKRKLEEKMEVKRSKIRDMQRLLASD